MALFGVRRHHAYLGHSLKRLVDLVGASAALFVLLPVFVPIAIAIKLGSRGPVFFRQQRLGLHERPFEILKFRSMRADASSTGPAFTAPGDTRVTKVGSLLRRTSLDELPQLVNVLCGDMSLIGPRPYVGFELEGWSSKERRLRASLRPGISGLSQTNGRSLLTADAIRKLDLKYVSNCSVSLDVSILLQTILSVLARRGTN